MARLTYKAGGSNSDCNGPTELGRLFVAYWKAVRDKSKAEVEALTASLQNDISKLFEETSSGEVEIKMVQDTGSVVHIPIPVPAQDLSKYGSDDFADAFGHAIIMGCGRSPKLQLESGGAVAEVPAVPLSKTVKAA